MGLREQLYRREAAVAATPEQACEAAQVFAREALPGWQVSNTDDGFAATGRSGFHRVSARARIMIGPNDTVIALEFRVRRCGPLGYLLWDAFDHYDGELCDWLQQIRQRLPEAAPAAAGVPTPPPPRQRGWKRAMANLLVLLLLLWVTLYFVIFPLIGLITGHLFLLGRSSSSGWVEGPLARILSGLLLLVTAYFFYWLRRTQRTARLADQLPIWQKQ